MLVSSFHSLHFPQLSHRCGTYSGSDSSSASVKRKATLWSGPNFGVNSTLLQPISPSPHATAAILILSHKRIIIRKQLFKRYREQWACQDRRISSIPPQSVDAWFHSNHHTSLSAQFQAEKVTWTADQYNPDNFSDLRKVQLRLRILFFKFIQSGVRQNSERISQNAKKQGIADWSEPKSIDRN